MTGLLRLNSLGRDFGGLTAVQDITLDIATGSRHAVIGPNGAGKTTVVNLIAGTLRPSRGSIVYAGRDITRASAPARARHGMARTFQHPAVFARLTVTANLALVLTHAAQAVGTIRHRRTVDAVATRLVDDAGLAAHATTPAGQLPYGLQRRLELAMALAARPRLLLLDEPSAGLDPDDTASLTHLIHTLTADTTVLLIDHNLDLVFTVADTVTVLHHGRHLATGTPDQIRDNPQVHDAYLPTGDQTPPARPPRATPRRPALLQIRGLRAGYRGAPVLDRVDLDVAAGEAVAVLGRNGAGKTTLLNTIAGLLPPHAGRIDIAGQPLPTRRGHDPARAGLAFVPQGRRLFASLTVAEHLTAAQAANRGRPRTAPVWTVERLLNLLPALAGRLHHRAHRLSGGEQQMLALARALLTNPRLLLLDEPSEGLAPAVIGQLTTTLVQLTADGLAVLIAEQNLALATAITDRVTVLDHGRIAMTCPTPALSDPSHQRQMHALLGVADPTHHRRPGLTS
jgi:ABC-type branched-subunit amino acid transport system ATPase component